MWTNRAGEVSLPWLTSPWRQANIVSIEGTSPVSIFGGPILTAKMWHRSSVFKRPSECEIYIKVATVSTQTEEEEYARTLQLPLLVR